MGKTRATIREAARMLDVSEGSIRKRIRRGTLDSEKGEDGRIYVLIEGDVRGEDEGVSEGTDALLSEMRGRIEDLRVQLDAEREANRENRRIIAALTSRIPELSPASEESSSSMPPGGPETATEQLGRVGTQPEVEGPQAPTRRPW